MTRHSILTSLMFFVAAAGWVRCPPPLADGNRAVTSVMTPDAAKRLRDRVVPLGCAVLGLAFLAAALRRPVSEASHERR